VKASIKIEAIGHSENEAFRLCESILEDTLHCGFEVVEASKLKRWGVWDARTGRELRGNTDYSKANGRGSRGVYIYYTLESGKEYFVKSPMSWKKVESYFVAVNEAGDVIRL